MRYAWVGTCFSILLRLLIEQPFSFRLVTLLEARFHTYVRLLEIEGTRQRVLYGVPFPRSTLSTLLSYFLVLAGFFAAIRARRVLKQPPFRMFSF